MTEYSIKSIDFKRDLIFGASNLAGMYDVVSKEDGLATLRHVVMERGIHYVDTAPHYGAGYNEQLIGEAQSEWPAEVRVSTKCGRLVRPRAECKEDDPAVAWEGGDFFRLDGESTHTRDFLLVHDYTAAGVRKSHDESVQRLGGRRIHCLRLHDAETEERFAAAIKEKDGAVAGMLALKEEGAIDRISLGMNSAEFALRFLKHFPNTFDEVLLAGCWNLMDQSAIPVFEECVKQGIPVILAGVFGAGLLWGRAHYRYEPASDDVQRRAEAWRALCSEFSVSMPAAALAFALLPDVVSRICIGCKNSVEFEANKKAASETVPLALWQAAKERSLFVDGVDFEIKQ